MWFIFNKSLGQQRRSVTLRNKLYHWTSGQYIALHGLCHCFTFFGLLIPLTKILNTFDTTGGRCLQHAHRFDMTFRPPNKTGNIRRSTVQKLNTRNEC